MAHVPYVDKVNAADEIRPVYEAIEGKGGTVPNFLKTLAHNPAMFQGFLALDGALKTVELDPKLRELAYLKASQVNGCDYCRHYHARLGRKAGLTDAQVSGIDLSEPGADYDELQWDVLRFADQVTRRAQADAELIDRLKQHLSDRQLVELTITVALANFTNRINNTLNIDLP